MIVTSRSSCVVGEDMGEETNWPRRAGGARRVAGGVTTRRVVASSELPRLATPPTAHHPPPVFPMSDPRLDYNGSFRLTRKIAEGGMASVYEAEQLGPSGFAKRIALKVIHPRL